jgi:hypothetical protein
MMPRPQFRLRSLFILTAIVAVGCFIAANEGWRLAWIAIESAIPVILVFWFWSRLSRRFAPTEINVAAESKTDAPAQATPPTN